ncbi:hypothetical protein JD844_000092 [Phrynosoma platyrhinos]|uniref:Uncharacterized protein n=1 Tax=Phrynosoma platyrhinos TaxID=52577 RepID=A0ABQ7SQ60_PHRPL|nr:hypothetical protein JD844_000092 [Phrynosoma platyrhinos]
MPGPRDDPSADHPIDPGAVPAVPPQNPSSHELRTSTACPASTRDVILAHRVLDDDPYHQEIDLQDPKIISAPISQLSFTSLPHPKIILGRWLT